MYGGINSYKYLLGTSHNSSITRHVFTIVPYRIKCSVYYSEETIREQLWRKRALNYECNTYFPVTQGIFDQIMVFCLYLHIATVKCHYVSNKPTAYIFTATRLFQVDIEVIGHTRSQ
jgi:hypothetical protein